MPDFIAAHQFSQGNRPGLETGRRCGCFFCLRIFDPAEIQDWVGADAHLCGIGAVLPENAGYPLAGAFLKRMREYWL